MAETYLDAILTAHRERAAADTIFMGEAASVGTGGSRSGTHRMLWRTLSLAMFAALTCAVGLIGAQAQTWPQKPVRIIVPYAAGGNSDGMARITAQRLTEAFGQIGAPDSCRVWMTNPGSVCARRKSPVAWKS